MRGLLLFLMTVLCFAVNAQKKWTLQQCVQHAIDNNIGIKQTALQTDLAALQLKQDKLAAYPTLNFSNSYGMSFGRRENPTTGIFEDQKFFNTGMNLQSSATIFNFYARKHQIASSAFELQASKALVGKQQNDIALSVANSYLQILLNSKQIDIVKVQLAQSQQQLSNTRKLVRAGTLPELNAAELEAQVARDSANVIAAEGNQTQAMLNLKNLLNIDAAEPFEVDMPDMQKIPLDDMASLQADVLYTLAINNQPQQKFNQLKYEAAKKTLLAAKSSLLPTFSAFGGMSSNYIYFKSAIPERVATGNLIPTGLVVQNGTTTSNVLQPEFKLTGNNSGYATPSNFFKQFGANLGQNIGIGINVPIFNGGTAKANIERSKINLKSLELTQQADNQKLKQDIYSAYNAAVVALQRFNASKKSQETAERSYNFAQRRYEIGLLNTIELITNQNNLLRAKLETVSNEFDYVFKMKVLEFYKGQGLKL